MKNRGALLAVLCLAVIGAALLWHAGTLQPSAGQLPAAPAVTMSQPVGFSTITNPVQVSGTAAGATFVDVEVVDENGGVLATSSLPVAGGAFAGAVWYRASPTLLGRVRVKGPGSSPSAVVTFPAERHTVQVAFIPKDAADPCSATASVERTVMGDPVQGAIEELLRGPFDTERERLMSALPAGVRLVSVEETDRSVRLVFSAELDAHLGGSCLVGNIRRQIHITAATASGGKGVLIGVVGKPDSEVLQP